MQYHVKYIEIQRDKKGDINDITFYFEETGNEPFGVQEFKKGSDTRVALGAIVDTIMDNTL